MKKNDSSAIAVLDIGTTKITCVVGKINHDKEVSFVSLGESKSTGLKRGVVVNMDDTVEAINLAVNRAEEHLGFAIKAVYVGISGAHISGVNSHGIVGIRNNQEVTDTDVDRVIEAARAVPVSADQQILHVLPQEFFVDNQDGISNPIGMSGVRLEAKVHVVCCGSGFLQNVVKCVERCGLQVNDVVFQSLAAKSVLASNEKELGVCIADIGGGTIDIAVFYEKTMRHSAVLPVGGDQVTNDLAVALRTPTACAETLKLSQKINFGDADSDLMIDIPVVAGKELQQVSKKMVFDVAHARYEELLLMVAAELRRSGFYNKVAAGIVLTGGGSKVAFCESMAERIFDLPVRIAKVPEIKGLTKNQYGLEHASSFGLLLYAASQIGSNVHANKQVNAKIVDKMKQWLQYHF